MSKIGIVIPVLVNKEGALELIESIRSTVHTCSIYIIPNWRRGWSVAKSWNEGIRMAKDDGCDYVVISNDDVLFSPVTLDGLVEDISDEVVITTCTQVNAELNHKYDIYDYTYQADRLFSGPDFACWAARSNIHDILGTLDENFIPAYFEDDDYCRRVIVSGLKIKRTQKAPMWHHGSLTQTWDKQNPACSQEQFEHNRDYYFRKWGAPPGFEIYDHPYGDEKFSPKLWRLYPSVEE